VKTIGLALGGGGARGLAHIPMLEVFDKLGVRPHRIAGTSIGSIMGGLYASGLSGRDIRRRVEGMLLSRKDTFREMLRKKETLAWLRFMDVQIGARGLLKGEKVRRFLGELMGATTFEELRIPLRVIATDFWKSEQVVLDTGDLPAAIRASMSLPGVFTPVEIGGRMLVDGGGVNPVPWDVLDDCDIVVAIDVMGHLGPERTDPPYPLRAILGMFDIMQNAIIAEKRARHPPDIYIKPDLVGIDILAFHKAETIYEQSEAAREQLKRRLEAAL